MVHIVASVFNFRPYKFGSGRKGRLAGKESASKKAIRHELHAVLACKQNDTRFMRATEKIILASYLVSSHIFLRNTKAGSLTLINAWLDVVSYFLTRISSPKRIDIAHSTEEDSRNSK